jgi:hypothetical protein
LYLYGRYASLRGLFLAGDVIGDTVIGGGSYRGGGEGYNDYLGDGVGSREYYKGNSLRRGEGVNSKGEGVRIKRILSIKGEGVRYLG